MSEQSLVVHIIHLKGGSSSWSAQVALEAPSALAGVKVTLFYQGQPKASGRLDEWGLLTLDLEHLAPPLELSAQVYFEVRALNPVLSARSQSFHPPLVTNALKAHLEAHRTWPRHLPLRGAQLGEVYLPQADLRGVDLRGADLTGATLTGALLEGVIFKDATLTSVDFTGADLTSARLEGAQLHGANLSQVIMNGADLRGARGLKGADLMSFADLIVMDERQMKALAILTERAEAETRAFDPGALEPPAQSSTQNFSPKTRTPGLHEGYLTRRPPPPPTSSLTEAQQGSAQPASLSSHLPPERGSDEERAQLDRRERARAEKLLRYQQTHKVRGGLSFTLNLIPEGSFIMGSEREGADPSVQPRHQVNISTPFLMLTTPVTQALYLRVMDDARFKFPHPDHPAESVSWYDALEFCNRLSRLEGLEPAYQMSPKLGVKWRREASGYRLPTEAEWEHAARAHNTLLYAGSDNIDEVAWYAHNANHQSHPVAQKAPNAWGLYDMSGNVWEWCFDLFKPELYAKRAPGPVTDPLADGHEGPRVLKGGSWSLEDQALEPAHRSRLAPHFKTSRIGFRVVRSPRARQ